MRIIEFTGKKIHNYIDFNIKLNTDLSILIGSNGSGKTSSLLLLQAIICPNFKDLFSIPFASLKLQLFYKKNETINVTKTDKEITIQIDGFEEPLQIDSNLYEEMEYLRMKQKEVGDINELIYNKFGKHKVIEFIKELPSPLFLNLERRNEYNSFENDELAMERRRYMIMSRNREGLSKYKRQFQGTLGVSLLETEFLIQEHYRRLRTFEDNYMSKLKDEILFSSFEYIPFDPQKLDNIKEKRELLSKKDEIEDALRRIGYSDNQKFFYKLNDFFSKVETLLTASEKDKSGGGINIELLTNQYQIEKLSKVAEIIDDFNSKINEKFKVFNKFLNIINSFFEDTNKSVLVDKVGHLYIKRPNGESVPIDALSSGERQILIMFANVMFNKGASDNILIIDEPELSLHIRWQERFVESLIEASSNTQFILATHSPDIVGDFKTKCVKVKND